MSGIRDVLITDRTQADVDRARYLTALWRAGGRQWAGTPEERTEWEAGPRGAYGFADWNRVMRAVCWLAGKLSVLGYSYPLDYTPACLIHACADPPGGGEVTSTLYYQGESANLLAKASDGFEFQRWEEDGEIVSTNPEYVFTVEHDRTLTAVFSATGGLDYGVVGVGCIGAARIGWKGV